MEPTKIDDFQRRTVDRYNAGKVHLWKMFSVACNLDHWTYDLGTVMSGHMDLHSEPWKNV